MTLHAPGEDLTMSRDSGNGVNAVSERSVSVTSSTGSTLNLTFAMQIGLVRESVTVEGGELTLLALKDIACAFVDRKVGYVGY